MAGGRNGDFAFLSTPVIPNFSVPSNVPPMRPSPSYGRFHAFHWLSILLFIGSCLAEMYFLVFHGLDFDGGGSPFLTLFLMLLWWLRELVSLVGLLSVFSARVRFFGWVFPVLLFLLSRHPNLVDGELWFIIAIALAWIAFVITSAAPNRLRSGAYIIPVDFIANGNTFGRPGDGLKDSDFSEANIQAGIAGERATAEALSFLLDAPGVYVFHGLQFSMSSNADVDHAVVYGNRVALIDSKLWPSDLYEWADNQTIRQGDGTLRTIHMEKAQQNYEEYVGYAGATVRSWVCIHPVKGRESFVYDNSYCPSGIRMGDASSTVNEIAEFLFDQKNVYTNRKLLNILAVLTKA